VGIPEGKRPLGTHEHRFEDNIKMDIIERGWVGVGWIGMVEDRDNWQVVLKAIVKFRVSKMQGILRGAEEFLVSEVGFCSLRFIC
jgi:hypothetical protein